MRIINDVFIEPLKMSILLVIVVRKTSNRIWR